MSQHHLSRYSVPLKGLCCLRNGEKNTSTLLSALFISHDCLFLVLDSYVSKQIMIALW